MELGMYVAASDLSVSKKFYSSLFGIQPDTATDTFVGFGLNGGRFGIIKETMYSTPLIRGNNAVLNIKVDNIDSEYERVKMLGPSLIQDQVFPAGAMRLFMFKDPDGNVVEFFSVE